MREYDLKKALSTGSYTRNSIRPQLLVAEDGEYRQGDILDANATMEVVNSTTSSIDDKLNDILGIDNGAVQELVEILNDSDTTTGILNELAKKANISDLSSVTTSGSYDDLSDKPHIPEDPVQSDWAEDDTTDQAYIKNKPTIPAEQIQSDWNQSDTTAKDYIKNKPNIPTSQGIINANGHEYIEIGGVKWATKNIGAETSTDAGLFFLWGDIQGYTAEQVGSDSGKKSFEWEDYKYADTTTTPGETAITKYNSTDGKTVLESSDDVAAVNLGGSWRMPTTAEWVALGNAVNAVWTSDYNSTGVAGLVCTDKIDSSKVLFFPAGGDCSDNAVIGVGIMGEYWSASADDHDKEAASFLAFNRDELYWDSAFDRYVGCLVRGVLAEIDTLSNATQSQSGLMSSEDKTKLDGLSTVATTGSYNDLTDKPAIPTKVSDLTNNSDFLQQPHSSNGHEYVEIAGIKWATENIGATYENDPGLYFAWGETEGYRIYADNSKNTRDFSKSEYKYAELDGSDYVYTKYNSTDGKSLLDLEDDAARANWGGNWRIPTPDEFGTLFTNCIATIVRNSSGNQIGFLFTDKTDSTKSIYFPGCRGRKDGIGWDTSGYDAMPIWTNQKLPSGNNNDNVVIATASYVTTNGVDTPYPNASVTTLRYSGRPVRAILDEPTPSTVAEVAITGDYNDLVNKPIIRSESLTLNLSDQTSTITGANNSGRVEIVIYDNTSLNDYTVSIDSSYKTVDGNQIVLSVPAGCYGEVCYTNIGGTIFAKGIKQLANS